jgi:hypothetical protein
MFSTLSQMTTTRVALAVLLLVCTSAWMYPQDQWTRAAGVYAPRNSRLVASEGASLLFSKQEVFLSDNAGYMWWSIRQHFPNSVAAACSHNGVLMAVSVDQQGQVRLHRSANNGNAWTRSEVVRLPDGHEIVDLVSHGTGLSLFTKQGGLYYSADDGATWTSQATPNTIGELLDVARVADVVVLCGTEGAVWKSTMSANWVPTIAPFQVGGMFTMVEEHGGTIWAGGVAGAARFDLQSRSWEVESLGLPILATLAPTPIDLRNFGGVLFALFREGNGRNVAYRWGGGMWLPVDAGGLPPGEHVARFRFGLCRDFLLVYSSGSDPNFQGVYTVHHRSPTSAGETAARHLELSPLPATDRLLVQPPVDAPMRATLTDMQGALVLETTVSGFEVLNLTAIPTGTYTLLLQNDELYLQRQVIVNR